MAAAMARGWAGGPDGMLFSDSWSPRRGARPRGRRRGRARELASAPTSSCSRSSRPRSTRWRGARRGAPAALAARAPRRGELAAAFPKAGAPGDAEPAVEVRGECSASPGRLPEVRSSSACSGAWSSCRTRHRCGDGDHVLLARLHGARGRGARPRRGGGGPRPELARELVVETRPGRRSSCGSGHPADVRRAVASPGGSTEAGLRRRARGSARGLRERGQRVAGAVRR